MSPRPRALALSVLLMGSLSRADGGVAAAAPLDPDAGVATEAVLMRGPQDLPGFEEPPPVEQESLGWALLRTMVVLGIVVLLAYLTLNVGLRRLLGIRGAPGRAGTIVTVVDRVALDPKRVVYVVQAAGEYLLLGAAEGGLSLLAKLDATEVDRLRQAKAPGVTLSPFLQKLLSRGDRSPPSSSS